MDHMNDLMKMRFIVEFAAQYSSLEESTSNQATASGASRRFFDSHQYLSILYRDKKCLWPFCGGRFDELNQFLLHLKSTHGFDLNTLSNFHIQSLLVDGMEKILQREKTALVSMFSPFLLSNPIPQQINIALNSGVMANPVSDARMNNATTYSILINNPLRSEHERVQRNPPNLRLLPRPISPSG